MSMTVTQESHPDRFQISEGDQVLGVAEYVDRDGERIFYHTEVGAAFSGRGIAGVLVKRALDATRAEGLRVVPVCPYVAKYVHTHHDWDDIVDPVTPAAIAAIATARR